ncbi:MAG: hypothetical protein WEE64_15925 [Dehalococcoidia bacterium]
MIVGKKPDSSDGGMRVSAFQVILFLALAWGGAAGIAVGVNYWLDGEGMTPTQTQAQIESHVDDRLDSYATIDDIRNVQDFLAGSSPEDVDVAGMKAAVARLLLIMAARDQVIPQAIHSSYFPTGSDDDFESCMDLLQNTAEMQTGGSIEACIRLEEAVSFP